MARWCSVMVLVLCLCGCAEKKQVQTIRVVTGITVTAIRDRELTRKQIADSEEMETVLNYLRRLDPYFPTEISPDSFRTDAYEISISYSDGENTVYRQIYDQYFQVSDGSWRKIDPLEGNRLWGILTAVTS